MTPEEEIAWQELERKQLSKKQKENEMKNKDLLFSHWYDSLEGTKSQGFAYKAWCAGWDASKVVEREQCAADYLEDCARAVEAARLKEREVIADEFFNCLQSDLEHGVKCLNETASSNFEKQYPALSKFCDWINEGRTE